MATTIIEDRRTTVKGTLQENKANQKAFYWILAAVVLAGLIVFFAARRTADTAVTAPSTVEETNMNSTTLDPTNEPDLNTETNAVSPGQNPEMPMSDDANPSPTSPANPTPE